MIETAATAFIAQMTAMSLASHQVKNVNCAVSLLCVGLCCLADINCTPQDIVTMFLCIFQITSITKFNLVFATMQNNCWLDIAGTYTTAHIFDIASTTY